ncbi:MAG: amidohydrolase family protein [Chloroflexi bacterium]|nr:amidohydrolase family protein [Chloroflexota bacterium]
MRPLIVDAHTHVFSDAVLQRRAEFAERDRWFGQLNPPGSRRLASPSRLVATMDAAGADVAIVLSFGWADPGICVEQNECVLAAARAFPGRVVPFCTVQPLAGRAAIAELERVARRGCRGVGELFPDGQGFALDDARVMGPVLEVCAALGLPVLVHGSEPLGRTYPGKGESTPDRLIKLAQIAREIAPELPLIFAHLGGGLPFYALMPDVRAATENVYYDTGACAYLYVPAALAHLSAIVPGRLLFGSDYPVIGMRRMLDYAAAAALPDDAHAALMGGNAADLLGIHEANTAGSVDRSGVGG